MEDDWRTIQFFLGPKGVSEIEVNAGNKSYMRCTCKIFSNEGNCSHITFMKNQIKRQNGSLTVILPEDVPNDEIFQAQTNSKAFRQLILKYGIVEVIE